MKKINKDEFVKLANEKHNNKFDYSNSEYVNITTAIDIICPVHGAFSQTPTRHLSGNFGCIKCSVDSQSNKADGFINKLNDKFPNKFNTSKVVYTNNKSHVNLICNDCGCDFNIRPDILLSKSTHGCPDCSIVIGSQLRLLESNEVIGNIKNKFGNQFSFEKFKYSGNKTKFTLICKDHGEFETTYNSIIKDCTIYGCPKCANEYLGELYRYTTDEFIDAAKLVHDNVYCYSKTIYGKTCEDKVIITCNKHGDFYQTPHAHLAGQGCPSCGCISSACELEICKYFDSLGISYIRRLRNSSIMNKEIDIYLPDYKVGIEYNGSIYHHSSKGVSKFLDSTCKDPTYHNNKSVLCYEAGIRLFHVYDFLFFADKNSVLSQIIEFINSKDISPVTHKLENQLDYFYVNLRCNSFSKKEDSKHVLKVFLH